MTIGAFALVTALGGRDDTALDRRPARHRAGRRPVIAALLAFFLLAQAGIPPTAGFIAKLGVFGAAAEAHSYALLIVGVVTSVITAFFYLRVILTMYAVRGRAGRARRGRGRAAGASGWACRPPPCSRSACWRRSGSAILPTVIIDFAHNATLII